MKLKKVLLIIIFILLAGNLFGGPLINFQGKLTDKQNNVLTGSFEITFSLYINENVGIGTFIWQETHDVNVFQGNYSVLLGSLDEFENTLFTNELWLGIKVGSDAEMTPRSKISGSAYAVSVNGKSIVDNSIESKHIKNAAVLSNHILDKTVSSNHIKDKVIKSNHIVPGFGLVPTGAIMMWPATIPEYPAGWLPCNGDKLNQADYSNLYKAIGNTYSTNGVDASEFCLPDLRGYFVRGWDPRGASGLDPDYASRTNVSGDTFEEGAGFVGTMQGDEFKSHYHSYTAPSVCSSASKGNHQNYYCSGGSSTSWAGGNETRPKNISMMFIIKY